MHVTTCYEVLQSFIGYGYGCFMWVFYVGVHVCVVGKMAKM